MTENERRARILNEFINPVIERLYGLALGHQIPMLLCVFTGSGTQPDGEVQHGHHVSWVRVGDDVERARVSAMLDIATGKIKVIPVTTTDPGVSA